MKRNLFSASLAALVALMFVVGLAWTGKSGAAGPAAPVADTTAAQEYSYSCLGGGCHETNAPLVDGYSRSYMSHVMVKCNACHGTHTAAEVGAPKPNITGYYSGIGATGYTVGKDRCIACHGAVLNQSGHPKNPAACTGCHAPHLFPR